MSILIKGMEMPESCIECDFCGGVIYPDGIYCCDCPPEISHGKNVTENIENDNRPGWCPLVEVPTPHGRLIDADALIARMESDAEQMEEPIAQMFTYAAINDVKRFETVIEAEEGEDE